MKRIYRITGIIMLAAIMTVSCGKSSFIMYNNQAMLDNVNGELQTDEGIFYDVAEDLTDGMWRLHQRIFLVSDILSQEVPGRYNVRIKQYAEVHMLGTIRSSEATDETAGADTTMLQGGWKSAKNRINLIVAYPERKKDDDDSFILEYEEKESNQDKLVFTIRRNSHGDHIDKKEIMRVESGIQYNQKFFTATYSNFIANPNADVEIQVMYGNNRAGNKKK